MIVLPFPPSTLSGHANGNRWSKAAVTAKHRAWAYYGAQAANIERPAATGDISVIVTFYPTSRSGDRLNYPNRCKPYFDGIAEALGVDDKRFVPTYLYAEPVKDPRVVVHIQPSSMRPVGDLIKPIIAECIARMEQAA